MHQSSPSRLPKRKVGLLYRGDKMSQLSVGSKAPDFELNDVDGRSYRLSEALAHGPVALVFYKASCPTCQFTFPYIQKIFDKAKNDAGWTLWAISEDDADETRQFVQRYG